MDHYQAGEDFEQAPATSVPPSFVLHPLNEPARRVVSHHNNNYYRHYPDTRGGTQGLWIGFSDKSSYTLGCDADQVDIYIPEMKNNKGPSMIEPVQASFQLVSETGAVLLHDHSSSGLTEPYNKSGPPHITVPFPRAPIGEDQGFARSVVVARGVNSCVAFGRDRFFQFELSWLTVGLYTITDQTYTLGPRKPPTKKYIQGDKVGGGTYGAVWSAIDIASGTMIAVKKFHSLSGKNMEFATREIANLFKIKEMLKSHEHILKILGSAGGGPKDNWGEIYMPLMTGNLKHLIDRNQDLDVNYIGDTVLNQMLHALDCISFNNIVHRDIKPENILWDLDETGNYRFCLGDFGLSHDPKLARTVAGTEIFMAPEIYYRQKQTFKVDIWSLFATVVWVKNTNGFRATCGQYRTDQIHAWLQNIAKSEGYEHLRKMGNIVAKKRPTAAEQLAILRGDWEEEDEGDEGVEDTTDQGEFQEEDEFEDELANTFGGMSMDGSGDNASGIPYYEPYTTGLFDSYDRPGEPSQYRQYRPPGQGQPPRQPDEMYATGYTYSQAPTDGSDEGTVMPTMGTVRPMPTQEEPALRKKKDKGKHRA
ncbi:hypothetical protein OQA88_11248 [Cercophora sp. LCS_1]